MDIYVTGSNSKLMSSEIVTYLTGRYISIPVFTLSFAEYLDFKKEMIRMGKQEKFMTFLHSPSAFASAMM